MRLIPPLLLFLTATSLQAAAPDFKIIDDAVHLTGVGPDSPIIYDNDWWFDVFEPKHFAALPDNPFCNDMRRLIASDLGQANQLGDGAPLVWLFHHPCWTGTQLRSATWTGKYPKFEPTDDPAGADVLDIPKSKTNHSASRQEFFRVLTDPQLFASP